MDSMEEKINRILGELCGTPQTAEQDEQIAQAKLQINNLLIEARIEESSLYLNWFNNDFTICIEDFIEDRLAQLKAQKGDS